MPFSTHHSPLTTRHYRRHVLLWLFGCAALVACMVLLGGYTRLSGSGLSITQWKPVHGVIPPMGARQWQEEFNAYRLSPQFSQINSGMTLPQFKAIFWPEFLHRLLGRIAGMALLLPFAWFAYRRAFNRRFGLQMLGIAVLFGLQGFMGWYMVKSGLLMGPYVSHLRLAAHLALAFLIFALLLWAALDLVASGKWQVASKKPATCHLPLITIFALLCLQILYGAFMAGLHGGLIYNTFPTMNGEWVPADMWALHPWWKNLFFNIATVQFIHRWLAMAVGAGVLLWWLKSRNHAMALVVLAQIALGVATLTHQVPLVLAMSHQFTALLLFGLMVAALHNVRKT